MIKVLITGSEGFIGSSISDCLIRIINMKDLNFKVTLLDKDNNGCAENIVFNLKSVESSKNILFVKKNLCEAGVVEGLEDFDVIVHMAALIDATESHREEEKYLKYNLDVTKRILTKVKPNGKFIFASSAAVYGIPKSLPSNELDDLKPTSPYGHTKLLAEKEIVHYCSNRNIEYNILRFFNVSGSYKGIYLSSQPTFSQNLFTQIRRKYTSGEPFIIMGSNHETNDGTCERDFIDINWLANFVCELVYDKKISESFITNVGNGAPTSIKQLVDEIIKLHPDFHFEISEPRMVEIPRSYSCVTYLSKVLNRLGLGLPPSQVNEIVKGLNL